MAITLNAFSSTHTVQTTEWSMVNDSSSIATNTTAGMYQPLIDLNALAAGDVFEWKLYEKTISGGTQRVVSSVRFSGVQGQPIWQGPAVILGNGWDMTLKKISGTDRSIPWTIHKAA